MGSFIGHALPGFGFFIIGLWHTVNHIKLHAVNPKSYISSSWFPTSRIKYLELYLIMIGSSISIAMELFIGPNRHQPLDPDGTIPSYHLRNFEHSNMSLSFFTYASLSIVLDKFTPPAQYGLTNLLGAVAFGQQFFLFHLHSSDHMGVEGQYHWLLQIVIFVSLSTTLLGISYPQSFLNSFVRSASIMFQGVWLVVLGYMLWTPSLIPKGCFINLEDGHYVVRCHGKEALERAKSLVNIQFSWYLILMAIFMVTLYLVLVKLYHKKVDFEYTITKIVSEDQDENDNDVEARKDGKYMNHKIGESTSFLQIGKPIYSMGMER